MRSFLVVSHDISAAAAAWLFAYLLRFNFDIPETQFRGMLFTLPLVVLIQAVTFHIFGLYRGIWRFASLPDLKRILFAISLSALAVPAALVMLPTLGIVPRSVLVLQPLLLVLLMGGGRFLYRAWRDGHFSIAAGDAGKAVLILGAGDAGVGLIRELASRPEWRVVGIVDDDPAKSGRRLGDVLVRGTVAEIATIAIATGATHAIIAMPSLSASERRFAAEGAVAAGLEVMTVPSIEDLLSGRIAISQIRRVELEDLLGRDRVELDGDRLHLLLNDKTVFVSGAGGSIGAELCRQIARFRPARLILYELSELALYQMEQEFSDSFSGLQTICIVGDVKDKTRLDSIFARYEPQIVFHAAAYKHVPLMENENSWEAIRNNVMGTMQLARAAKKHNIEKFVMISTDKAVNPTNVMGASKRLAERVCQLFQGVDGTRFITVRFGNVLGSNGSVIPKFREQIARGGPVTVTHPEIIRYFMLIPEAAQLVLQAGGMGCGGEIFVLEMGEPIRIADLARDMIHLSGFSEDEIKIEFTGLRPGEKLFEELLTDSEHTLPTPHSKLRIAQAEPSPEAEWQQALDDWLNAPAPQTPTELKIRLKTFVPEYSPQFQ